MSNPAACFDSIIGLSRTGCPCYTDTMPADASDSASELFLDELPGLNLERLFKAAGCGNTAWQMMAKAREEGLRSAKEEVLRYITQNALRKRPNAKGQIGDDSKSSRTITLGNTYHGLSVEFAHHVGGTATITRIGGKFKYTGNIQVDVYDLNDEDRDTPIETRTISVTQNRTTWTSVDPIVLSLETEGSRNPWFHFLFTPAGNALSTLIDRSDCGCGGKSNGRGVHWNQNAPWYESGVKMNGQMWTLWAMAAGTKGEDLDNRENWTHTNETQGLMLDVTFACDPMTAICNGNPDYVSDPIQVALAYAVRFKAATHLIDALSGGVAVDREAILGGESIGKMRQQYSNEFKSRIEWIGSELTREPDENNPNSGVNTYSDCFTCDHSDEPVVRPIQV